MSNVDLQNPAVLQDLVERLYIHLEQDEERNKHLDSILREIRIYNRGVPMWLIYILVGMGFTQMSTMVAVGYLFLRLG